MTDPLLSWAHAALGALRANFHGTHCCCCITQALAKYAFGMGTLQMVLCTGAFSLAGLPVGQGLVTHFLEDFGHASHNLVSIRTVDEVSWRVCTSLRWYACASLR